MTPLTLENIGDSSIADGLATREELDSVLAELYGLAGDSTAVGISGRRMRRGGRC